VVASHRVDGYRDGHRALASWEREV
jgi:hypothetical protein